MSELESSLTTATEETTPVVTAGTSPDQTTSQPPVGTTQPVATPTAEEVYDWSKDERFEKMWKKDPNGLYKSYRNIEKMVEPMKTELGTVKQQNQAIQEVCEEFGITTEQLKDIFTEHKTLKDPDHPENKSKNYFQSWLGNDMYKDKVLGFFQELEKTELQRLYPNMNAEQIKKQVEMEQRLAKMEAEDQKRKDEAFVKDSTATINSGVDKAKKYAEARGFTFDDKVSVDLLDYCQQNGIDPKFVYHAFIEKYGEQLDKTYADRIKSEQLKALEKNKGDVVLGGGASTTVSAEPLGTMDSLKKGLREAVNKMMP
jgi:hypothetical protein